MEMIPRRKAKQEVLEGLKNRCTGMCIEGHEVKTKLN